jgi:hypothetical protein
MKSLTLDLVSLIDWPAALGAPRYAGGHEQVMRAMFGHHAEVIAWWSDNDYQGTIAVAYRLKGGEVAIMTDYYGSCSGCDAWEGVGDEQAKALITGLCGGAKVFDTIEAAAHWTKNIDPKERPWEFPWGSAANLNLEASK